MAPTSYKSHWAESGDVGKSETLGLCPRPGSCYTADEVFTVMLGSNSLANYNHTVTRAQERGKGGSLSSFYLF